MKAVFFSFLVLSFSAYAQNDDFIRGESLFMENRAEEAVPFFKNAISAGNSPKAYNYLALCYEKMGLYSQSLEICTEGMKVSGTDKKILAYNAGNICFAMEDYYSAEKWYSLAMAANRLYAPPVLNRANAELKQEKYLASLEDYKLYLDLSPNDSQKSQIEQLISLLEGYKKAEEERIAEEKRLQEEAARITAAEQQLLKEQEEEEKRRQEAAVTSQLEAMIAEQQARLEQQNAEIERLSQESLRQEEARNAEYEAKMAEQQALLEQQQAEIDRMTKEKQSMEAQAAEEKKRQEEARNAEFEARMAEQQALLEQQRTEIERMLQEQRAYQEASLQAQKEAAAKKAEEDAARRRKLLEDVAASLQNSETSNMSAGAEGTIDYGYESELE